MDSIHVDAGGRSEIRYPASAAAAAATTTTIWSGPSAAGSLRDGCSRASPRAGASDPLAGTLHHRLAAASSRRRREGAPSSSSSRSRPASERRPVHVLFAGGRRGSRAVAELIDVLGPTDRRRPPAGFSQMRSSPMPKQRTMNRRRKCSEIAAKTSTPSNAAGGGKGRPPTDRRSISVFAPAAPPGFDNKQQLNRMHERVAEQDNGYRLHLR